MRTVLCLLVLLLPWAAVSQPYYFRHYQVENGLSHNTVFCSVQDNNGFLWFGTKDGLNRFDGYRFKTFRAANEEENDYSSDQINALAIDSFGTLWVGGQKGLFRFDSPNEMLVPVDRKLQDVYDICVDKHGNLWFTSGVTLVHYNIQTNESVTYPPENFFQVTALFELNGKIWLSTTDGYLQELNPVTGTFRSYDMFAHSPRPESRWVEKIVSDGKGSIYAGTTSQGIKKFRISNGEYTDLLAWTPDKTAIYVRDILQVGEHEFWFATESGIFILDELTGQFTNLKKKYVDPYSLSDNAVYSLLKDREGGIWAGTYFGGVNYYATQSSFFHKYYPDHSLNSISGNIVREICRDSEGHFWISTEDAGINKLNPKTGEITQFFPTGRPGDISYPNIHGMVADGNKLWIGTFEHGVDLLDINSGKVVKRYKAGNGKHDLKSNFVLSFLKAKNGDLYLATSRSVFRYNRESDNFDHIAHVPPRAFCSSLLEDHRGIIWVGTYGSGIYYFDPATGKAGVFKNDPVRVNSITSNTINSIYEDRFNNLWFGTEGGGICKLDRERKNFRAFTTKTGLPSNFVFKILEEREGDLWVTTSKGLVSMDHQGTNVNVFTSANGLLNDQFNYNSGYKDADDNFFFGSVRGMISFNAAESRRENFTPPVFITGFQVHGKELEIGNDDNLLEKSLLFTDHITLSHDKSSFSVDFAAITFSSPEMTDYSYIMLGLDKNWTNIKSNRKVYFTNLDPGKYQFKVRAAGNGFSVNQEKTLSITILPPFWATPLAYLVYVIAGISILLPIIKTYHKAQENKKQKEIYEAKINFFTNIAHEIKTPLTLIKGPVENLSEMVGDYPEISDDVIMMERNTNRLLNLTNQILDFRQVEAHGFSLDFAPVSLNTLLSDIYTTFEPLAKKRKLTYSLKLPEQKIIVMADDEALHKIYSNLFSNAIKYASKEITIELCAPYRNQQFVSTVIRNDGYLIPIDMKEKIFEPFFRLRDSVRQKGTGIGLALAKSLTDLHKGFVYVGDYDSKMNTFILELPYSEEHPPETEENQTIEKIVL